jgi:gas vesicle protein
MAHNGRRAFAALMAGVGVGAVIGLCFASQPGAKTRRLIASKTREIKDSVGGAVSDAVDSVSEAVGDIRAQMNETVEVVRGQMTSNLGTAKERIQQAFRAGRRVYRQELSNLRR